MGNWPGDSFQSEKVLFTSNLSTNGALMVQKGLAYSIAIEGSVPFWNKEKITYRPLYPDRNRGNGRNFRLFDKSGEPSGL